MRSVRVLVRLGVLLALVVVFANVVADLPGEPRVTRPSGRPGMNAAPPSGPTGVPETPTAEPSPSGSPGPQAGASSLRPGTGPIPGRGGAAARQPAGAARGTLTPAAIAPSDAELPNPFRGSYEWLDVAPQPAGWPVVDSYVRVGWRELETQQDRYDFTYLDQQLARARARQGKLGIRVMPACTGCGPTSIEVPDYLKALMPRGFWFRLNGTDNYAPDWNSTPYLDRLNLLLQALGRRYDNDPRLGWVEISGYGDWGEWHTTDWPYPSAGGATPITDENARRIVDMNVAAFPHKRLLMQHAHEKALAHALSLSSTIGVRNDCLGDRWFTEAMTARSSIIKDRWKTAPIITEYCYQSPHTGGFRLAADQIRAFHVAMIGNGNMDPLPSFSAQDQNLFRTNNKSAGYRFVLDSLSIPSVVAPGSSFSLVASWSNVGVTPSYVPWSVSFRLTDPTTGAVVWQGPSQLDLSTLLPTGDGTIDHPVVVTDTGALPPTVRPGSYDLSVIGVDPADYYRPIELSIAGRRADGSYPVGTATVR